MTAPLTSDDPQRLGRYQLLGRLGEGGMGTVYLGQGPDDRLVAVKVIRSDLARIPEFRARFRREADLARRIARFCTAEVLDVVDPPNEAPYLVTEFVDGPTLAQTVTTGGPLNSADLERVAVSVAAALTAIHSAGLVHRDLKPSNVLLSPLGPRVIDFGIARALDSTTMISQDVQRVGTPAFMAPEQVESDSVTAAADIFAWGGLVTYASTGRFPFGDGPSAVQLYRVVHHEPDLGSLDDALRPVVEQAMRKNPAARPSAQELFLKLVNLGSATHPDPEVTALLQTSGSFDPAGEATIRRPPAALAVPTTPPPVQPTPVQPTPAHQAPVQQAPVQQAPVPTPTPVPPPSDGKPRPRRRKLVAVAVAAAAAVVVAAAAVVPLVVLGDDDGESRSVLATQVAEQAERTRGSDRALSNRLSLAAYRISDVPEARRSLITSFSGPTATVLDNHASSVLGVAVSPDGKTVASAAADNTVKLWDVSDQTNPVELATMTAHTNWVLAVAFSPDGRTLATASNDKSAILWDVSDPSSPAQLSVVLGHTGNVYDVAFSPDGRLLATAGYDNTARLWDVSDPAEPTEVTVLHRHTSWVNEVVFSPDSTLVATASADTSVRLWDITNPAEPRPLATLTGHEDFVWAVAISPDGATLASAGHDGLARLWNITDPAQPVLLDVINADADYLDDIVFSPDGTTLAAGGWETTVKLWDVSDPAAPVAAGTIGGHGDWIQNLAFFPDGKTIASASDDRTVRLSSTDPVTVASEACLVPRNQISQEEWETLVPEADYQPVC